MNIIKVRPQGFCKGVINAIELTNQALENATKPIYMLGSIVHNSNITDTYSNLGIITIKNLDEVNTKKGSIIITAHGISNYKLNKITNLGLDIIDTTCESVKKIQDLVREMISNNYTVIYYGVKNHAECLSIEEDYINNPNFILINNISDIEKLDIKNENIFFTNQTTMSYFDTLNIIDALKVKYPNILIKEDICTATKRRQLAFKDSSILTDYSIVVGDKLSNNTKNLVWVCENFSKKKCYLVESINDLKDINFKSTDSISITSGASTPSIIVDEVINKINDPSYESKIEKLDYIKTKANN